MRRSMRLADVCTVCSKEYLRQTSVGVSVGMKTGSGGRIGSHAVYRVWMASATYGLLIVAASAAVT